MLAQVLKGFSNSYRYIYCVETVSKKFEREKDYRCLSQEEYAV